MDIKALMQADYLDIIFDRRNKNYGGYQLRKSYNQRVGKAMAILYSALALLVLFAVAWKPVEVREVIRPERPYNPTDFDLPVHKIIPPKVVEPPAQPKAKVMTKLFTDPVITNDPIPDDKVIADVKDLKHANSGLGSDGDSTDAGIAPDKGGGGTVIAVTDSKPDEPRVYVEQMPVFDGDMAAYLARNVRYPDAARENGIEGRVLIEFVVNKDGTVTGARVAKGIGGGCDQEALRVVAAMPKWKPGRQNGNAVSVYFKLAVNFVLE